MNSQLSIRYPTTDGLTASPVWRVGTTGRSAGMALVEMLLAASVIGIVLGGLILASQSLRTETCEQQTRSTLRHLRAALRQYHQRHGAWPSGPTITTAVKALRADPAAAPLLAHITVRTGPGGQIDVHDGYGRPIRYVVEPRGGKIQADFVSAGPDGRFGDPASTHSHVRSDAVDNLYGSELETPTP